MLRSEHLALATPAAPAVNAVAYANDGLEAHALAAGDDRTVALYKLQTRERVHAFDGHSQRVLGLCVARGAATFASCGDERAVHVWDVPSGRALRRLSAHAARVNAVAYAGDASALLVSASYDATVRCWDCRSRSACPVQTLLGATDSVSSVAAVGHEILAASVDGAVRTYDVRAGRVARDVVGAPAAHVSLSHDGGAALVGTLDSTLRLLDRSSGGLLQSYSGHRNAALRCASALSHDDAHVLGGSEDGTLHVWHLVDGTRAWHALAAHEGALTSLASASSRLECLTAGTDGAIRMWSPTKHSSWRVHARAHAP